MATDQKLIRESLRQRDEKMTRALTERAKEIGLTAEEVGIALISSRACYTAIMQATSKFHCKRERFFKVALMALEAARMSVIDAEDCSQTFGAEEVIAAVGL